MTSYSFPDLHVWLALATSEHMHAGIARRWWREEENAIAFCRLSQLGFLRLVTTAAVMDGKPLSAAQAWRAYDRFFEDDRVTFLSEPHSVEKRLRELTSTRAAIPKVWTDAYLLAFAQETQGTLITLDRALATRGARCLLPTKYK